MSTVTITPRSHGSESDDAVAVAIWARQVTDAAERIGRSYRTTGQTDEASATISRLFFLKLFASSRSSTERPFKLRGATNKMLSLCPRKLRGEWMADSNGNLLWMGAPPTAQNGPASAAEVTFRCRYPPSNLRRLEDMGDRLQRMRNDP